MEKKCLCALWRQQGYAARKSKNSRNLTSPRQTCSHPIKVSKPGHGITAYGERYFRQPETSYCPICGYEPKLPKTRLEHYSRRSSHNTVGDIDTISLGYSGPSHKFKSEHWADFTTIVQCERLRRKSGGLHSRARISTKRDSRQEEPLRLPTAQAGALPQRRFPGYHPVQKRAPRGYHPRRSRTSHRRDQRHRSKDIGSRW